MQREYYGLKIIYKKEIFCIWVTSESGDKFLICNDKVLSFTDEKTLNLYCKEQQIPLAEKECTIQKIPAWAEVKRMLKKKDKVQFCKVFLNLWNLALDMNNSFGCHHPYLDGCRHLYDKIFWGNNLDVFTQARTLYVPHFSKKDCRQIEQILHEIYAVFEMRLLYPAGQNDGNPFEGK